MAIFVYFMLYSFYAGHLINAIKMKKKNDTGAPITVFIDHW